MRLLALGQVGAKRHVGIAEMTETPDVADRRLEDSSIHRVNTDPVGQFHGHRDREVDGTNAHTTLTL
jgi:hypothetical protein